MHSNTLNNCSAKMQICENVEMMRVCTICSVYRCAQACSILLKSDIANYWPDIQKTFGYDCNLGSLKRE